MAITYTLKLSDFSVDYSLTDGVMYQLADGTLDFGAPEYDDSIGEYTKRDISFELIAVGNSVNNVIDNVDIITSMIHKARNAYDAPMSDDYGTGYNQYDRYTGDSGVVLFVDVLDGTRTLTREDAGSGNKSFRINVKSGTVTFTGSPFQEGGIVQDGNKYKIYGIQVTLECDPFFTTQPEVLAYGKDVADQSGDFYPRGNKKVIVWIDGDVVGGVAPAPTRIVTREHYGGTGAIISRFAGDNLWLSPSVPEIVSGSATNDFFTIGKLRYGTNDNDKVFRIKYTGTNTFQYSDDDGATWSTNKTVTVHQPYYLDTDNNYGVVFLNDQFTYTSNDYRFYPNQTMFKPNATASFATGDGYFYSNNGWTAANIYVNVPAYAGGRYLIAMYGYAAYGSTRVGVNWSASVSTGQIRESGASGSRYYTWTSWDPVTLPWVFQEAGENIVLLGELDLSRVGAGYTTYSNGHSVLHIAIRARGVNDPGSTVDVTVDSVLLLSAQDDYSTMITSWGQDFQGYEVYSSLDMKNPYVGELSATAFDTGSWGGPASPSLYSGNVSISRVLASSLGASMFGNPITLYPRVDNYVLLIPVFQLDSADPSWRKITGFTSGFTKEYYIAARERHLIPGGS